MHGLFGVQSGLTHHGSGMLTMDPLLFVVTYPCVACSTCDAWSLLWVFRSDELITEGVQAHACRGMCSLGV